ncbi:DUF3054 domain-containing protein [Leucobacter triazinivorans]|uniref:DUF3054 domain-containing protein n=1 Tax=Leucobacter triazinivorans TaxID=1784719 RepID=A0A4P6KCP7_9MICO|nr:DUF3054 domain-containing protein [Leucobacter triazinivorans]QBE47903.1 DUF3054 domain-containing protein [Leucobacter triazinivorans]
MPGAPLRRARPATIAFAAVCDALLVTLFAGIGRSEHERAATLAGLLETAWPFLAGLAIAWCATFAWRRPLSVMRTGIPLWIGSVAIGMVLRALTGAGTALPFVIVATLTLGAFLLGWRALAALIARLRRA